MATAIKREVKTITDTVNGSATKVVDSIALAQLCAIQYWVCLYNETENKYKTFQLFAKKKSSTQVGDILRGKSGGPIDLDVFFNINGVNAELSFVNNESYNVEVDIKKIVLP